MLHKDTDAEVSGSQYRILHQYVEHNYNRWLSEITNFPTDTINDSQQFSYFYLFVINIL